MIKTQHKRVTAFIAKQGEILKKFKDVENFFGNLEQKISTIYYKIGLCKFLIKHLKTKNLTLPSG